MTDAPAQPQSDAAAAAGCPASGSAPNGCPVSPRAAAFDPFDRPYQLDPAEALRWSREEEPVFYSPKLGYWVVSRYDDVKAVFRDNITFSPSIALEKITPAPKEAEEILKGYGYKLNRTLVNEDEPDHMERRRALLESFTPENLARHEPMIRDLTRRAVDRIIDRGEADLVEDVFWEIPLVVGLHFLGVSEDDIEDLKQFSAAHTVNTWGRPAPEEQLAVAESVGRFWQAAGRILDKMRADPSGDGWMQFTIRQQKKYPDVITDSYLHSMMMAILVAAHETTSYASLNAFNALLRNRDAWEELCRNPALIPNAAEECLRYAGSVVAWRRRATSDADIGGVPIPEGAKLLIVQASANHDPRHFENPDELDIYRANTADHLTFGYGSHQCLGKNIGRMEMRIFLEEFTRRLPHMELVPDQALRYLPNTSFRGPQRLRVRWTPEDNPERRDPALRGATRGFPIGPPEQAAVARRLRVAEIRDEADGVRAYVLEDPRGRALPKWSAGSHIDLADGAVSRMYSLCGAPDDAGRLEIAILREAQGRGGSAHFHDTLAPGSEVRVAGPKNHFHLDETAARYLLIAGGIGITPILAMADRLKALGKPYAIHYGGRARPSMAYLDRLAGDHGDALHLYPRAEGRRMDLDALLGDLPPGVQVYACGPERLLEDLEARATAWPENTLHVEHFTSDAATLDPEKEHAFDLVLKDSDLTVRVGPGETALDALRAAGIDVPSDCCEGLCGTCEVAVLDGAVDHRDKVLSRAERAAGDRMMTCCSRAAGGRLVLGL